MDNTATTNFRNDNHRRPNRRIVWQRDRKFRTLGTIVPQPVYNQHNMPRWRVHYHEHYRRVIYNARQIRSPGSYFTCWEPTGRGVDTNRNGYHRINFRGGKVLGHVFTYLYFHPGDDGQNPPISHLCGNRWCFRPSHLTRETLAVNVTRVSCPGYIQDQTSGVWWCLCRHRPRCKRVHVLTPRRVTQGLVPEISILF